MSENPPAFPSAAERDIEFNVSRAAEYGMTLLDYFAGQVLPTVCDSYPEWQIKAWFGDRISLKREEIRARAAYEMAAAMLAEKARLAHLRPINGGAA